MENEQQNTVNKLTNQPPDEKATHADVANRYEQTIAHLKDLVLWPMVANELMMILTILACYG